ncbi:MAG: peptidase M1 [Burkholderiales bacterium PBB3]|nr:MAG: peptidase M1 [Burkholderiales bacterium PBB3]
MRRGALVFGGLLLAAVCIQAALYAPADPDTGQAPPPQAASPSLDGIALAAPNAAAVTTPSAASAWGGPRTGSEATLSDRVVNYEINVTLDPVKHTLNGTEKLTWRNRSAVPVRSVYLHLYLNAFESSNSTFYSERKTRNFSFRSDVPVEDGEWGHIALTSTKQGDTVVPWQFVHPDGGPETDHTVVRLDLPQAVPPGQSTLLNIGFKAQLPRVVARTGYFGSFHLVGQWFPKMAVLELPGERGATALRWNAHEMHLHSEFYADYGNFDVKMTVPQGYTVAATGEEQGPPVVKDGQATYHYVQGDVHDFAWMADNRTAKPLEATWTGPGSPSVKVKVLFPPEYESNAAPVLKATTDSLDYFSKTLGAYPYKTITAVIPPFNAGEAGGMEYPTFFTASSYSNLKPDTLQSYGLNFVTIHEFGHGYFYGILGSNEFEEPMLDEGFNEYWNARMLRERGQKMQPIPRALRPLGLDLRASHFDIARLASGRSDPADALGHNSWDRLSSGGYSSVYSRTATVMRDLEERLTSPVMEKAFKAYYAAWKYRHPSIADFQQVLIEVSGKKDVVNAVFAQQVYATSKVDDRIEKFSSEEELPQPGTAEVKGQWVEATQDTVDKQISDARKAWRKANPDAKTGDKPDAKDVAGPYPYRTSVTLRRRGADVPQVLVVKFADGTSETVQWNDADNWKRYSWVKPAKAVSAELDPQRAHFLDASKVDDARTLKTDRSASQRWGSQLAALFQVLFSLIATV